MYRVERGDKAIALPDTDPRWRTMPRTARLEFVDGRFEGFTDEQLFDALGLPVKPLDDPRWARLSEEQQVQFLLDRIAGASAEDVFAALGQPKPAPDPAATPDEDGDE